MLHEIAVRHGLGHIFHERPAQVSYFDSLRLAFEADGLLILGVDDIGYTPSKLFNYLLFGKPVLACFQQGSPAEAFMLRHPETGALLQFGGEAAMPDERGVQVVRDFLQQASHGGRIDRGSLVADFLAPAMAERHAELFDRIVGEPLPAPHAQPGEVSQS
jgi:hypothetical protein